jgi:hypothetical protein
MNKKETFQAGMETGYSIAQSNLPDLNSEKFTQEDLDTFQNECVLSEMENYRQYSPFEFFAAKLNEQPNAENLWDSYDSGVDKGISRAIREWKKENKKGFVKEISNGNSSEIDS